MLWNHCSAGWCLSYLESPQVIGCGIAVKPDEDNLTGTHTRGWNTPPDMVAVVGVDLGLQEYRSTRIIGFSPGITQYFTQWPKPPNIKMARILRQLPPEVQARLDASAHG